MVQYWTWFLLLFCVLYRLPIYGPIWIVRLWITAIDTQSPSTALLEAYLVKILLVQSPAESRVKWVSSTNALYMDQSSVETVLTEPQTHKLTYEKSIFFFSLVHMCMNEFTIKSLIVMHIYVSHGEKDIKRRSQIISQTSDFELQTLFKHHIWVKHKAIYRMWAEQGKQKKNLLK